MGSAVRVLVTSNGSSRRVDAAVIAALEELISKALNTVFEVSEVRRSHHSHKALMITVRSSVAGLTKGLSPSALQALKGHHVGHWLVAGAELLRDVEVPEEPQGLDTILQGIIDGETTADQADIRKAQSQERQGDKKLKDAAHALRMAREAQATAYSQLPSGVAVARIQSEAMQTAARNASRKDNSLAHQTTEISPCRGGPVTGPEAVLRPLGQEPQILGRFAVDDDPKHDRILTHAELVRRADRPNMETSASRFAEFAVEKGHVYPSANPSNSCTSRWDQIPSRESPRPLVSGPSVPRYGVAPFVREQSAAAIAAKGRLKRGTEGNPYG